MLTIDSAPTEQEGAAQADPSLLRRAYAAFPSGVTAVCASEDGVPVGLAASSFTTMSLDPPLVAVGVQRSSSTWPRLRHRPRLGLSVLADGQADVCRRLASNTGDRFAGLGRSEGEVGALLIEGAAAWFECSLHSELPAGDHVIALLRIRRLHTDPQVLPLVFHNSDFRSLGAMA